MLEEKLIALVQDVAAIRAEAGRLLWMQGVTLAGVLALVVKTFFG